MSTPPRPTANNGYSSTMKELPPGPRGTPPPQHQQPYPTQHQHQRFPTYQHADVRGASRPLPPQPPTMSSSSSSSSSSGPHGFSHMPHPSRGQSRDYFYQHSPQRGPHQPMVPPSSSSSFQQQPSPYLRSQPFPNSAPYGTPTPRHGHAPPVLGIRTTSSAIHGAHPGAGLNRSKSLTRPERQRPRSGMLRSTSSQNTNAQSNGSIPQRPPTVNQPMSHHLQQQLEQQKMQQQYAALDAIGETKDVTPEKEIKPKVLTSWWAWTAYLATCCIPNWFIRICLRKPNPLMQQAWREKLTLVYMFLCLCGLLAFVTYGLNAVLCPTAGPGYPYSSVVNGVRKPVYHEEVRVFGRVYPMNVVKDYMATKHLNFTTDYLNMDIGSLFDGDTNNACGRYKVNGDDPTLPPCQLHNPYGGSLKPPGGKCLPLKELQSHYDSKSYLGFEWEDLRPNGPDDLGDSDLLLLGDSVLNLTQYLRDNKPVFGAEVDKTLRRSLGNDVSYALLYHQEGLDARRCLAARYSVGIIETETGGCIAHQIIMNVMLAVIICMIVIRYAMALLFQWIIARKLVQPGGRSGWLAWRSIKGGNDDPANHIPGPYNNYGPMNVAQASSASLGSSSTSPSGGVSDRSSAMQLGGPQSNIVDTELYTVMLVTCYSEGEEGLRTTMDSLAETTYSKKHKIFFVIADGLITGAGETRSTPDIVVDMMELDPAMANPKPATYLAIADGEKQLNRAKVYAGHYKGVACITIVKCGTEEEQDAPKAGNRGKRDSQLILMSFFQRVLFNDRLSELDYEMFWKMTWLMKGVTPDKFELVLMVDADTKVLPDAITYMVAAMANDITIMGLCGETRIANKRTSWVTAIQVFEYYISHHYAKAFESLFGIVTCLPGCFSMYRIKSPKNGAWVPILANPDIILEYNQNIVTTLHEKNLLLLGEDRFLSTLMLRTFPKRQMMFVPQARCKTVVPDEFRVLLSQRRRWINSTVHNLMELVLVSDLCGIACLSMQFSVFVDLIGTLVLPAAIVMSIYLIVNTAVSQNPQWQSLALLLAILGLPGILIAITTFKIVYIGWMIIYICALPIWNFVLPIYSFWHFDDFSWGATRVVAGEKKDKGHDDAEGKFDSSRLVMKKWEDWEAERTGQRPSKNKMMLKTPMEAPAAFDGLRPSMKNTTTPTSPAFGSIFNDRKMFGSSTSLNNLPKMQNKNNP
ncbi:chitin synthase-domain-containing protein [Radiomyces spectabilis]|uniref:chitin synthase-domain-containing protein n=1 Tax=Radiomyces spectabilis TaxID=64574 RepID=UPI002220BB96|nr:chitin synthase-domain-containing protein [Radiomyces spectabilis]KAI8377815.1 chitin synthase-domain-containing protein [Radiomyces spectabilis]